MTADRHVLVNPMSPTYPMGRASCRALRHQGGDRVREGIGDQHGGAEWRVS